MLAKENNEIYFNSTFDRILQNDIYYFFVSSNNFLLAFQITYFLYNKEKNICFNELQQQAPHIIICECDAQEVCQVLMNSDEYNNRPNIRKLLLGNMLPHEFFVGIFAFSSLWFKKG